MLFWGRNTTIAATALISLVCTLTSAFIPLSTYSPVHHFQTSKGLASTTVPRENRILRMSSSVDGYPRTGDVVTIEYSLTPNGDFVPTPLFDSGDHIRFILNHGNYLPAIHTMLSTMRVGQSITEVEIDAGWGSKRSDLIATISKEKSSDNDGNGMDYDAIKVGTELYLSNGTKCRVVEVTDTDFTIDANPPLAGASYMASVKLLSVEPGPGPEKYAYSAGGASDSSPFEVMTIALGCFWGGELEYMRVPGVIGTSVGYTQGETSNPTYKEVCSGTTGHTEAIQVVYDPSIVAYETLTKIGMERLGDSRYLKNQTGNDRGTQYRHGIYYHNNEQKKIATDLIKSYGDKCVTECLPAEVFYEAEDYHQQYLLKGGQSAKKNAKEPIRCYG